MIWTRQQSTTAHAIPFLLVLSTDSKTGATGKTPTLTLRKPGGSFAAAAGAVTEIAHGWYEWAGHATDRNTAGPNLVHVTAADCDAVDFVMLVSPLDVFGANLGLANLDAAVSSRLSAAAAANGDQYVSTAGNDSNDGYARATAKLTISAAIAAAGNGGTVIVGPGTFDLGTGAVDLGVGGTKTVHLRGAGMDATEIRSHRNLTTQGAVLVPGDGSTIEDLTVNLHAADSRSVALITRSGSTATATHATAHTFVTGMTVRISGAGQPEYNGDFTITVTNSLQYTFSVSGTPATPATGTITATSPIYQGVGMNHSFDFEFASAAFRRCRIKGTRATDAIYVSAFSGATQTTIIEDCILEAGWDCVRTFFAWQNVILRNTFCRSLGACPVDPTQARGLVYGNATVIGDGNVIWISGGTSLNRGGEGGSGGNTNGQMFLLDSQIKTSGTGALDLYGGTVQVDANTLISRAKVDAGVAVTYAEVARGLVATDAGLVAVAGDVTGIKAKTDQLTIAGGKVAAQVLLAGDFFQSFPANFATLAIDGDGKVTADGVGGGAGQVEIKSTEATIE